MEIIYMNVLYEEDQPHLFILTIEGDNFFEYLPFKITKYMLEDLMWLDIDLVHQQLKSFFLDKPRQQMKAIDMAKKYPSSQQKLLPYIRDEKIKGII